MSKYRFDEIAINKTKKRMPQEEDFDKYIGLSHLDTGEINVQRWGSKVPIIGEKLIMKKGDVLLGKRNAYLRRAAISPHDGLFSAHGMVLQPKLKVVDKDFFPLFIGSDYFFDSAIQISVGSLSPTINWRDLRKLEFYLPPLEKQKELSKVLWSIKDTIGIYKKMIISTDELIKSKFHELFNELVAEEKGWKKEFLAKIIKKPASGEWGKTDKNNTGIPVIRTANFTDTGEIDYEDIVTRDITEKVLKQKGLKYGDILIEKSGGSDTKPVGRVVFFEEEENKYLNNNFTAVLRTNNKYEMNKRYLFYFLFDAFWAGKTRPFDHKTTGLHNLDINGYLDETYMYIPPIQLQNEFEDFINESNQFKFMLETNIANLEGFYRKLFELHIRDDKEE